MPLFESLITRITDRASSTARAVQLVWSITPRWLTISILVAVLQSVFPLIVLYLTKLLIDQITASLASGSGALNQVALMIAALGGVLILQQVFATIAALVTRRLSRIVTDAVTHLIHDRVLEADLEYFENPRYHQLRLLAQQEGPTRPHRIVDSLISFVRNAISLAAVIVLIISLHWGIALLLFAAALPGFLINLRFARILFAWAQESALTKRQMSYHNLIVTFDIFVKEVRVYNLGRLFSTQYHDLAAKLRDREFTLDRQQSTATLFATTLSICAVLLAMFYISTRTMLGAITIGSMVMYFQAFQQARSMLTDTLGSLSSLNEHHLFLTNFYAFMELKPRIAAPAHPKPFPTTRQRGIEIESLSFAYPEGAPVLHEINMHIRPGEIVALVGNNGAGKSTLVKLLCRLYDPLSGRIRIEGTDIRDLDPADLRRQFSIVFQDHAKYAKPAWENIWLGDITSAPDHARIREAAEFAGADTIIDALDHGFETMLTRWYDGGRELSQGQWQRMAIARAFYRNSPLVILDEPSSALDVLTEDDILKRLAAIAANRSALVISHRMSTVRLADRIYVLDAGRIAESGSHSELMSANGLYAHLFNTQASRYTDDTPAADPFPES